jgi:GDP-4-dehydro-6-deoxy-D-mannose reductase
VKLQRVLVTGASGFIGRATVQYLRDHRPGWDTLAVDRVGSAEVAQLDLANKSAVASLIADVRPGLTFHLAGIAGASTWSELYEGNVQITANLLEALVAAAPGSHVVVPGSAAEYGHDGALPAHERLVPRPVTPYGTAKAWQSTLACFYSTRGLHVSVGRIFNICGPGLPSASVLGSVVEQLRAIAAGSQPGRVVLGWTGATRDFLDIDDVCSAMLTLGERGENGGVYNVCSGAATKVSHAVRLLVRASGLEIEVVGTSLEPSPGDIPVSYGDNRKLRAVGWRPLISLEQSLRRALRAV